MTIPDKKTLRTAAAIHEHFAGQDSLPVNIGLPEHNWHQIQTLRRQIEQARRRDWHGAARVLVQHLLVTCESLGRDIERAIGNLNASTRRTLPTSVSAIVQDLLALRQEFGEIEIDLAQHTLTVQTEPIEFDDVYLGPFEILLDWSKIGRVTQPYRVVAIDPHPAARRDDVTHPHVQDEQLCEGEGRAAIASALAGGRLYDFFLLVNQTLQTYGRGSAYVEVGDWLGMPCEGCGYSVGEDDRYVCENCGSTLCDDCSHSCPDCERSFCIGCMTPCADCGQDYCSGCLVRCRICRKRFCEGCCEEGLCKTCYEEIQEEEKTDDDPCDENKTCLAGSAQP